MIGGLPENSFVFMEFQEVGGVLEVATLALGALGLDFAEVGELAFGGSSGLVFVEEAAAVCVVRCSVFGGKDGGSSR
jgi:hypothetical protein